MRTLTVYCSLFLLSLLAGCASAPSSNQPVAAIPGSGSEPSRATRQHIVKIAESLLGVPYKWGGTTRGGMDCSGVVNYAYNKLGIPVPRTAHDLYFGGQRLERVKPGDLLFYKTSPGRISHVGIYVGDGKMIHASTSKRRVIKANINIPYWRKRWVGGATYLACAGHGC
ncbi:MAG: NlpC/P60 family protein [Candidatus Competibacteraceae bacterium]|jgi:cell wall-associated NlpC family hydrolase|nr:NlpC/P60 family protein [Candidatus Competibacteraceae bacterium]